MMHIRNIVAATDFSELADAAVLRAAELAKLEGASVHVVHALRYPRVVIPYEVAVPAIVWQNLEEAARVNLEQTRTTVAARGVRVSAEAVPSADAAGAIAAAADAHRADLVVMGTHGRGGVERALLGSVAERALRLVDRPILAVKRDGDGAARPIDRILLAVDFSAHSDRAVEWAAYLAQRLSASVDVLHAFDLPRDFNPYLSEVGVEVERKIEEAVQKQLEAIRGRIEQRGVRASVQFRRGHPHDVIAETARTQGHPLIVMGARGHTGISGLLLGSVAERTLRAAPCSVLCVKDQPAAP